MQDNRSAAEPQTWLPRVRQEVRGDLVYPLVPMKKIPSPTYSGSPSNYEPPTNTHTVTLIP